jgi:hypothetical protein
MVYDVPVETENVRTFKNPNGADTRRTIVALVRLADIPDFPLNPDPRIPKKNGQVVKTIRASALLNDGLFHEKNRGITLCVKEAEYDNRKRVLYLNIPAGPDEGMYGIVDGGHTHYAVITAANQARQKLAGPNDIALASQYVRLEIMVGVESDLAEIAEARNFSAPLADWSLEHYRRKFDWFLNALGDYRKYVRVVQNETQPVPIMDLIQVMCAINPVLFPEDTAPLEAYKNAGKCLEYFVADDDPYRFQQLAPVAPDIVRLYDYIRLYWDAKYNEEDEAGSRGRLERRKEMWKRKRGREQANTYYFVEADPLTKDGFPVEKGLALPVISAFRVLLETNTAEIFRWIKNPFDFFDRYGTELVREVMETSAESGGDTHNVGRDRNVYRNLYRIAQIRLLLSEKEEKPVTKNLFGLRS